MRAGWSTAEATAVAPPGSWWRAGDGDRPRIRNLGGVKPDVLGDLNGQQITYFVILIVAFGLLITERLRNDITALLIVLALAITHILEPKDALGGFSSEPAIVVAG